jgi:hypothetical protein
VRAQRLVCGRSYKPTKSNAARAAATDRASGWEAAVLAAWLPDRHAGPGGTCGIRTKHEHRVNDPDATAYQRVKNRDAGGTRDGARARSSNAGTMSGFEHSWHAARRPLPVLGSNMNM